MFHGSSQKLIFYSSKTWYWKFLKVWDQMKSTLFISLSPPSKPEWTFPYLVFADTFRLVAFSGTGQVSNTHVFCLLEAGGNSLKRSVILKLAPLASSPSFFSTRRLYFSSTSLLFSIFCTFHQVFLASTQKSSLRFAIIHTVDFKFPPILYFLCFCI